MARASKKAPTQAIGTPVKEFASAVAFAKAFAASDRAVLDAAASKALHFVDGTVWARSGVTSVVRNFTSGITTPFAVPADRLGAALDAVAAQNVEYVELALDKNALVWKGGAAKGRIALVDDKATKPEIPTVAVSVGADLAQAFTRVLPFAGRNEQFPMLRGAFWSNDRRMLASDGDRLVSVELMTQAGPAEDGVLVPDHLLRAMRGFEMNVALVGDREVWFGDGISWVSGLLLEAQFPHQRLTTVFADLSSRAESGDLTRVDVETAQPVKALLAGVAAVAEAPLHAVNVQITTDRLEVWCEREDGEVRVDIMAKVAGAPRKCRINAQYLLTAMDQGVPVYFGDRCLFAADDARKFMHAAMFFSE